MGCLTALPSELLQQIAEHLDRRAQKNLALTSASLWDIATTPLWRDVKLIDTRTNHWVDDALRSSWPAHGIPGRDEHDDTPIIRKLLVLASNPRLAAKVRILTHKCHLPMPAIFQDLPRVCFENGTLSSDWRTVQLALLAANNMHGVRVLRLINGHHNLVAALLNGFYGLERKYVPPHLWVESCSLHGFPVGFESPPFGWENGLLSVRLRRLKLVNHDNARVLNYWMSRAGQVTSLHNGTGGTYETTTSDPRQAETSLQPYALRRKLVSSELFEDFPECVKWLNAKTYEDIPEVDHFLHSQPDMSPINDGDMRALRQRTCQYEDTIGSISSFNSATLRSLNLDWILMNNTNLLIEQYQHFERLSTLHFPNLRAFQLRNAVTDNTTLADHVYLLQPFTQRIDDVEYVAMREQWHALHCRCKGWCKASTEYRLDMLSFMERHPNLECLAWPMDRFFAPLKHGEEDRWIKDRAAAVVANLGRTLVNLRVDCAYTSRGEPQTDEDGTLAGKGARLSRRLFISEFAAHMTKLKVLKLEGGIPRDEKRELMGATSRCPLEKLVMIAVSCPLGNTWGINGEDLSAIDEGHLQFHGTLEAEPEEALIESTKEHFFPGNHRPRVPYRAEYGWPAGPSLLHSIALHHASTITELKFCGYNGSPILHKATPITDALLHHLKHFHRLKKIVLSFWLLTFFDFDWREPEIIDYWLDQREPTSMALVPVPLPAPPPAPLEPEVVEAPSWESLVAADAGTTDVNVNANANAMVGDGHTVMGDAQDANMNIPIPSAWSGTLNALAALDGQAEPSANDNALLNPDAMMAAVLGTGMEMVFPQPTDAAPTVVDAILDPGSNNNHAPAPIQIAHPIPSTDDTATSDTDSDTSEPVQNPWEVALREHFSPLALARGVYAILGPHLSPQARNKGVRMRASFCLGVESGDIFDLDFRVDARSGGVDEGSLVGPREESEKGRWWGKLEGRGWFG